MLFFTFLTISSSQFLNKTQANELLADLIEIEQNLNEILVKNQEFKSRYDFLMEHDQKLRSKINFIRYFDEIKPFKIGPIEIPLHYDSSITKDGSLLIKQKSKLSFSGNKFVFAPKNNKLASTKKITFDTPQDNNQCLIQSFQLSFTHSNLDPVYITNLNFSSHHREIEFPSHILFDTMTIEPLDSSKEKLVCIPFVHAYGEREFNEQV